MTTARHLSHLMAMIGLRVEIVTTLDELEAHPLTQAHVPTFKILRDEWVVVFNEELALRDGISSANARIASSDATINFVAGKVSRELRNHTDNDTTKPLYISYFKQKNLSDWRRPVLGEKLDAARGWVSQLQASGIPQLVEYAAELDVAVKIADEAVQTRSDLEKQTTIFRETGNRKKLFDKVNATRKQTYGELAKLPYEHHGLPSNFASLFFRHETSDDDKAPTIESVKKEMADIEKQMAEKQDLLKELEVEAEQAAKAEAEKAAKRAAIAELQKLEAEATQKAADIRAKIEDLSK